MKIINRYLLIFYDSGMGEVYKTISEVVELENGSFYRVKGRGYDKLSNEELEKAALDSKDI